MKSGTPYTAGPCVYYYILTHKQTYTISNISRLSCSEKIFKYVEGNILSISRLSPDTTWYKAVTKELYSKGNLPSTLRRECLYGKRNVITCFNKSLYLEYFCCLYFYVQYLFMKSFIFFLLSAAKAKVINVAYIRVLRAFYIQNYLIWFHLHTLHIPFHFVFECDPQCASNPKTYAFVSTFCKRFHSFYLYTCTFFIEASRDDYSNFVQ